MGDRVRTDRWEVWLGWGGSLGLGGQGGQDKYEGARFARAKNAGPYGTLPHRDRAAAAVGRVSLSRPAPKRGAMKVECPRCGTRYTKEESAPGYTCPGCGAFYGVAEPVDDS